MVDTSRSLLNRLREGNDPHDWERLVQIYTPWLSNWLRRQGVVNDVDDLVQDVMMVIVDKIKHYEHNQRQGAFRNYLRKVAFHRLSQKLRKRTETVGGEKIQGFLAELDDPQGALSRQWERDHDRFVMRQMLESMRGNFSIETWRAFELVMLEEKSAQTAAEEVGVTVNAVYIAKSRVLKRLREEAGEMLDDVW